MRKTVSLMFTVIAAAALTVAAASAGLAAPEPPGHGGATDSALLTVATTVGDDVFATTDLASLLDPTGTSTGHYGPYPSTSPDSGTCGNNWADDAFDRHFTVHNQNGAISIVEQFKDGSFETPSTTPPDSKQSPGACQTVPAPVGNGGMVNAGVTGSLHGYFIITTTAGTTQTNFDPHCDGVLMTNDPCDTATFVNTHFSCTYGADCNVFTFFFHYSAGDQSLTSHEWKNASADRGGNSGDIRSN